MYLAAPEFLEAPSDIEAPLGLSGELVCRVNAVPEPSIRWVKEGSIALTSSDKYTLTADGSLIVHDVSRSDEAVYECVAENSVGVARASARLYVLGLYITYLISYTLCPEQFCNWLYFVSLVRRLLT